MKILIVEDEKLPARRLERLTREILGTEAETLLLAETLEEAEKQLFSGQVDLLLLDLNLSGEDGFELLRLSGAGSFKTIVVSANTDRALEAFDYGVADFVPKPFDAERLLRALDRVRKKEKAPQAAKYLSVRKFGKVELVKVEDVLYFQGAGDYVELHLRDGRMELHSKTLEALEALLPAHFERVHKSYIVDMREMRQIHLHGGGKYQMELKGGALLPVSRTKYKEIKQRVEG